MLGLLGYSILQTTFAQVPDAPLGPPAPAASSSAQPAPASGGNTGSFLGKDVPKFDPKSEMLTWDGKSWNINNNRMFQARFEKYLNAPEETDAQSRQYQAIIAEVLNRTAQASASRENIDYAFKLLVQASKYDIDSRLSDSLADAVYTVWMAKREQTRLVAANKSLQFEVMQMEAQNRLNAEVTQHPPNVSPGRGSSGAKAPPPAAPAKAAAADAKAAAVDTMDWKMRRLTELVARQTGNTVKRELSELQAKVEFQALVLQFFLQRRFQHVLMGTRFYRAIFADGDTKVAMSKETKDLFTKNAGFSPTISTIDAMANEAIRDVREGVKAFEFLVENRELESGTKRLAEAMTVGEYMPEIRTLPRTKKRLALEFTQKANQLQGAMEAKDYATAETVMAGLSKTAKDFDGTQPKALIESSRRGAKLHLLTARNAAQTNDQKTLKESLTAATELWPMNPALAEFSEKIFDQGDVQLRALNDFDALVGQKNYRQIFDDQARFIAAIALHPERKPKLQEVLQNVQTIEAALLRAQEMKRQSNFAGAWESVEKIASDFPEDTKLNQMRADLTSLAADFVRTVRTAQELEKKEQVGSSLAWFLKAQKIYPASDFATEGVGRLKKRILPEG